MDQMVLFAADFVAVTVLTFGLYFRRHRRRDLVVAFLGINIGVLAVASSLSTGNIGAGLGLGLFGVLSIIRLRSTEIEQHEVAYYFSALALGILGGIGTSTLWLPPVLMALILIAMYVGDHPRLLHRYGRQTLVLDGAATDRVALVARLEHLLGARVHGVTVQRLDLVNDTTVVEVRYEHLPPSPAPRAHHRADGPLARTGARQ
ncbi:DUF4956 domain-containing protein [Cellulomonas bogoriensis]|uniref:Permease n=1 Tax=Cellulomonas bogoriensis 69B4 = DSM 16987 TaxID=1386082 RepID=A0A0A0C1W3_9CELL|nr:DUF4956 domain-containing protein [Cellulomonas bogoriensis]KGM13369.1 permease [Cellulomonas bogoriensis 69B4 = DSM 16987]